MFAQFPFLPRRFLFSDRQRCPDWRGALTQAGSDCGLILRDYDLASRAALARDMAEFCRDTRRVFFIAGDRKLAHRHAAGFHCPSHLLARPLHHVTAISGVRGKGPTSAAVHNGRELRLAARARVQLVFISPVFATQSHAGEESLGLCRARALARQAHDLGLLPFALGGLNAHSLRKLNGTSPVFYGFGAIKALAR